LGFEVSKKYKSKQKIIFSKILYGVINPKFGAVFDSIEKIAKKSPKKSYEIKTF
jgi:hypothetical protein